MKMIMLGWLITISTVMAIQMNELLRESYTVQGLEKYGARENMFAGLMPLELSHPNSFGSFFFWLVKQRNHDPLHPNSLVIWLNGGPGCSSMVGMMWENGPFTIEFGDNKSSDEKYRLKYNPYSWNEISDVLYVEQPLRTGFASAAEGSERIRTEKQIGEDFRKFLLSFVHVFTEYQDVEIYLTGESYAGFYIPWIANSIVRAQMKHNPKTKTHTRDISIDHINLVGAAIGNGVIDYLHQEPSYAEYAYSHGLIPLGAKRKFDLEWEQCVANAKKDSKRLTRGTFDRCNMMGKVLEAAGLPNEYNTATFIGYDKIIKQGGPFDTFFQDPEIQAILHVRGVNLPGVNFYPENYHLISNLTQQAYELSFHQPATASLLPFYYEPPLGWKVCNDDIDTEMNADHPISAVSVLQFLSDFSTHYTLDPYELAKDKDKIKAKANLRILLYSGEFDLNCNTLGTLHTLEDNIWRKRHWYEAQRSLWKRGEEVAGEYFTMDEIFSFLIVRNSGHLLPMDLPETALEMLHRFIRKKSFADVALPSESYYMDQVNMEINQQENRTFIASMTQFISIIGLLLVFGFGYFYYVRKNNESDSNNRPSEYRQVSDEERGRAAVGMESSHERMSLLAEPERSTLSSGLPSYQQGTSAY